MGGEGRGEREEKLKYIDHHFSPEFSSLPSPPTPTAYSLLRRKIMFCAKISIKTIDLSKKILKMQRDVQNRNSFCLFFLSFSSALLFSLYYPIEVLLFIIIKPSARGGIRTKKRIIFVECRIFRISNNEQ